jgi:hypothetical protein
MLISQLSHWTEAGVFRLNFEAEKMSLMSWSLSFQVAFSIGLEGSFGSCADHQRPLEHRRVSTRKQALKEKPPPFSEGSLRMTTWQIAGDRHGLQAGRGRHMSAIRSQAEVQAQLSEGPGCANSVEKLGIRELEIFCVQRKLPRIDTGLGAAHYQ